MKTCLQITIIFILSTHLLFAGTYGGGSGTSESPYLISTASHLYELYGTSGDWGKHFKQTTDITVTGTWTPIGNSSTYFTGNYNGDGHTISGITIDNTNSYQGMFGKCNGATIQKLGLINLNISGGSVTGGLVGLVEGSGATISECYTSGNVTGTYNNVGGLIGNCSSNGSTSNCYSRASVATTIFSGGVGAGGLLGTLSDNSTISNCYSTGSVSGPNTNGGLIAASSGTVNNSFWDKTTSGIATSAGGTGKTTAEMKTQSTFTGAGWSSEIWYMDTYNNGYPYLHWENEGTPLPVELTLFSVQVDNWNVILNWQTATEIDNYGFEVERAIENGQLTIDNWVKIGLVQGQGNSNSYKTYSYTDKNLQSGKYLYRLKMIDTDGSFEYSNEVEVEVTPPTEFALYQNYPNPFNPTTKIRFTIPSSGKVTIKIFNILGEELAILFNDIVDPGKFEIDFNTSNFESGLYLYRLVWNESFITKKMLLVK